MKKVFLAHGADQESMAIARFLAGKLADSRFPVVAFDQSITPGQEIGDTVLDVIKECSVVIALLTRASSNIFYEIGYAEAIGKKIVILRDSEVLLPVDLNTVPMVPFDRSDPSFVHRLLQVLEDESPTADVDLIDYVFRDALHSDKPEQIFDIFRKHKGSFERIDNRTFEEIVSRLFESRGFRVQRRSDRWRASYDFAAHGFEGTNRILVECKKHNASGKISVGQVQQLREAVVVERADFGVLVTPSQFTRSALDFGSRCLPRVELWSVEDLEKRLRFTGATPSIGEVANTAPRSFESPKLLKPAEAACEPVPARDINGREVLEWIGNLSSKRKAWPIYVVCFVVIGLGALFLGGCRRTDADVWLEKSLSFYKGVQSYQDKVSVAFDVDVGQFHWRPTIEAQFFFARPNKLRVDLTVNLPENPNGVTNVSLSFYAKTNEMIIAFPQGLQYIRYTNVTSLDPRYWNGGSEMIKQLLWYTFPAYQFLLLDPQDKFFEWTNTPYPAKPRLFLLGNAVVPWEEVHAQKAGGHSPSIPRYRTHIQAVVNHRGKILETECNLKELLDYLLTDPAFAKNALLTPLLNSVAKATCVTTHSNISIDPAISNDSFDFPYDARYRQVERIALFSRP